MKAGFGKCDITPRVGVELYGFGPFLNRKSIGVRDILEARSAALECGGHTVVIVSLDLCALHFPDDGAHAVFDDELGRQRPVVVRLHHVDRPAQLCHRVTSSLLKK